MLSLAKPKFKSVKVLICKSLINSNISHNELFLMNNVPKKFDDIKQEIKNYNAKEKYKLNLNQFYLAV